MVIKCHEEVVFLVHENNFIHAVNTVIVNEL